MTEVTTYSMDSAVAKGGSIVHREIKHVYIYIYINKLFLISSYLHFSSLQQLIAYFRGAKVYWSFQQNSSPAGVFGVLYFKKCPNYP